jgi:hypothetical protein
MFLLQRRIVRERTVSCGCVRSANGALTLFVPISMRPSSEEPHEAIPAIEPVANRFGDCVMAETATILVSSQVFSVSTSGFDSARRTSALLGAASSDSASMT